MHKVKVKKNQDGIGLIELFLIFLIIIILALLGWYVWTTKKNNDKANQEASSASQSQPKESAAPVAETSALQVTKNIIKFKEIGVQITVPDTLKDIVYTTRDGKLDGGKTFKIVDVSTSSLVALDAGCKPNGSAPPLGGLSKTVGTYPKNADNTNSSGSLIKQFDTYYIAYGSRQAFCSDNKSIQDKAETFRKAFEEAIKSVEEIK